jgi:acyl dehydratase
MPAIAPGLYAFEDVAVGDHYATGGIVVTEAHVVGFAGVVGDFFDLHMDDQFARDLGFPRRVAHGLLGLSLIDALKNRAAVRFHNVASLGWTWSFKAPIFIGDRIAATVTLLDKRATRRPERGIFSLGVAVAKQDATIVQEGRHELMVLTRAGVAPG